ARAEPPKVAFAGGDAARRGAAAPKPGAPPAAESKAAAPPAPKTAPAVQAKPAEPKPPAAKAAEPRSSSDEIAGAVRAWAAAWAKKDADAYLAHYARDFKTPKGEPRAEWEATRRQRIAAPKKIEVSVESLKVSVVDDKTANVTFRQSYRSDTLKAVSTKTLVMVRANGRWLIRQERVGS
ncbi:MAG: nuclear transport factor 2 family protein, partial [Betaproteobacteria bacterium]|nr:nuclear transport factor 2 family protein [Betaproteobacteria bacterium]